MPKMWKKKILYKAGSPQLHLKALLPFCSGSALELLTAKGKDLQDSPSKALTLHVHVTGLDYPWVVALNNNTIATHPDNLVYLAPILNRQPKLIYQPLARSTAGW